MARENFLFKIFPLTFTFTLGNADRIHSKSKKITIYIPTYVPKCKTSKWRAKHYFGSSWAEGRN